jgi:hypothetical protein
MKNKKHLHRIIKVLHDVKSIFPFTQKPPVEPPKAPLKNEPTLGASDLFCHFTADIIKEQVIFTR